MTRRHISVLFALVAIAACGRKGARAADFDSATAAALATGGGGTTSNLPHVGHVSTLTLAHSLDRNHQPYGGPADQFKPSDSVLVSIRTMYVPAGSDVSARVTMGRKLIDSTGGKTVAPDSTGVSATGLGFLPAKGWVPGSYLAEVYLDGKFQTSTPFTVRVPQ